MDKNTFWQIIDEVNSKVPDRNQDDIIRLTQEKLLGYGPLEIIAWKRIQNCFKEAADTNGIFEASCNINDFMTDDGFMDFRMWLIFMGREVYMAAIKDPGSLADLDIVEDTRFEVYAYVASDAFEQISSDDFYYEVYQKPLSEAQKADILSEVEYDPREAEHCMTKLEKMKNAAQLIEDMTGCRFRNLDGIPFINSAKDEYFSVNMRREHDNSAQLYRIRFDANLQTLGHPMNSAGLLRLKEEVHRVHALLAALNMQEYTLTDEEMQDFNKYVEQRELQEVEASEAPQLGGMEMT